MTWKTVLGIQGLKMSPFDRSHNGFLLTFHGPISYRFRDRQRFRLKIAQFPPVYFAPPLKGFPVELGVDAGGRKTRMMGLPGRQRSLTDIFSHVHAMHQRVRRTGGRTDTGRQQRTRLRIPSRGKYNDCFFVAVKRTSTRTVLITYGVREMTRGINDICWLSVSKMRTRMSATAALWKVILAH